MKTINLKALLKSSSLDRDEIAKELFPGVGHTRLALARVMNGDQELTASQISKLAFLLGCEINDLFSGNEWKSTSKGPITVFKTDKYRAELDTRTLTTKLYAEDTLFHTEVLHHHAITLDAYLAVLESAIAKHNEKG